MPFLILNFVLEFFFKYWIIKWPSQSSYVKKHFMALLKFWPNNAQISESDIAGNLKIGKLSVILPTSNF